MIHRTDRRTVLAGLAAGAAAAALPALPGTAAGAQEDSCAPATPIPNVVVRRHDGRRALFYNDLVRGKIVLIHFVADPVDSGNPADTVLANLARVQAELGERLGRDVFFYSIVSDPEHAGPQALARLADRYGAGPGWVFLSGEPAALQLVRDRLFVHDAGHTHAGPAAEDCSRGLIRYGNEPAGVWGAVPARTDPDWLAERIAWVTPQAAAAPPRRRGPAPLRTISLLALAAFTLATLTARSPLQAQACQCPPASTSPCPQAIQHPHMQCPIAMACATTAGDTTTVCTGSSLFPPSNPFQMPPGTNFLPTVYTNIFDVNGHEMLNTLPSTPAIPYNLHDGTPVVSRINPLSPTDDLHKVFTTVAKLLNVYPELNVKSWDPLPCDQTALRQPNEFEAHVIQDSLLRGIDILEGNEVPNREYSGFPLLHFDGPEKVSKVTPVVDADGKASGEVHIHQVWYDQHIESDTAFLDLSAIKDDVPWTMVYTVDVLNRGKDDFSPFVMYFAAPWIPPAMPTPWGVAMDQSFFPIEDGTRTVFRIKMAPARYYSLTYTWGWRMHPPRAQVIENAAKRACTQTSGTPCPTLVDWEVKVFGEHPRSSEETMKAAIAKIGDLDPAKRMWTALRLARDANVKKDFAGARVRACEGQKAYFEWRNRTKLPSGVKPDLDADLTLLYVNNTIYGQFKNEIKDLPVLTFPWFERGTTLKVTVYNGDYFEHGYQNVDFGGARGWENQFKSSVKVGGSGCWFTFGRAYWSMNLPPSPVLTVPAATPGKEEKLVTPGVHKFNITFNYDPSRRLRFYQFDPLHHDVAIYSVH